MHDKGSWREVDELLTAGQYERLAELLHEAQVAIERGGDAIPAHVLVLARRICLACSQSQAEADWHQQACGEAVQREEKLRQQLCTLLDLVSGRDLAEVPGEWEARPSVRPVETSPHAPGLPQPAEGLSLWQRIQGALGWRLARQPPKRSAPSISVEALARPSTGRVGSPAEPLDEKAGVSAPPRPEGAEAQAPFVTDKAETRTEPAVEEVKGQVPRFTQVAETPPAPAVAEKQAGLDMPSLVVYCLGPFRVYQDDHLIADWPSGKGKCILKYMIANRDRPIPKDILMDLFWRGADPDAARNNLNVAIYGLRQALRALRPDFSHILFQDDHYLLNPSMVVWVDVEEFLEHYEAGRNLERMDRASKAMREFEVAEGLYQGDFLEEDLYEDWPMLQREGLKDSYLVVLDRLSRYYLNQKRYATSIHLCQKLLAKDDCREDAHRRLMECFSRQGQRNLALRQYQLCVKALKETLDVDPMEKTVTLYREIRSGKIA